MEQLLRSRVVVLMAIAITLLILTEVLLLVWLATSVSRFNKFWVQKTGKSGEITYLALGDSAAQGIGATSPMRGYVGIIAKRLETQTGQSVRVVNLSVTGAKMQDYLNLQAPAIKKYKPDVITIEIGANDVANYNASQFRSDFKKVLKTLPSGSYVSNMPLFNSRPGSTENAKSASRIVKEELRNYPDLVFVDLQKQTQDHQSILGFAPDLFHPNNLSYKNWADAFWIKISHNLR